MRGKLRILFQLFIVVAFVGIIFLGVRRYYTLLDNATFSGVRICIADSLKLNFITESDINKQLKKHDIKLGETKIKDLALQDIEDELRKDPYIHTVEVYSEISGKVNVRVTQFNPIMRVIDSDGVSYFVSSSYDVVKARNTSKLSLPIITQSSSTLAVSKLAKGSGALSTKATHEAKTKLQEVHNFLLYMQADKLSSSLFVQANISSQGDIELIPRIGSHYVVFSSMDSLANYKKTFSKMNKFYSSQADNGVWTRYKEVNMKYKGQVVCRKK